MVKKQVTIEEAKQLGRVFGLNYKVVPFDQWLFGLNVELEHGTRNQLTNVTDDDLIMTAKITLAHLMEFPNYYEKLDKMEQELENEWSGRTINIFKLK